MRGFGSWMDHDTSITTKEKKKEIMSSVLPSTGPPDLNLMLTEMDSPLVSKLKCCAKAVADGDLKLADVLFEEVEALITTETNEVTKKAAKYFAEALVRRVHGLHPRNPMPLLPSTEMHNYPYTQEIPLHLFATIATNYDMLQSLITERSKPIHFIDFSMAVSYRYWRDWFFCYGMRVHGSQSFRVTSVRPKLSRFDDHLQKCTCQQLITQLAPQIDFQCEEVFANSAAEIVEAVLNLERKSEDETIIVRWVFELHKLLAQEGAIEKVLSKLKDLRPDIMVIVEQEANHNSSDFFNRFSSSFDYYHGVFEASEQYDTDPGVNLLSEMHLRRQISNVVASEGIDRFERHETFDRWQKRLSQAGFNSMPLWSNELKNRSLHPMSKFIIVENNGFPMLRFLNRPLAVVSVWKPVNPAKFNDVDRGNVGNSNSLLLRGGDLNYPITIQDTDHATLPFETEAASSSDSEDDIGCHPDMMTNRRIWSEEEVKKYLISPLTEKEKKRIVRWMDRKMTGTFAGHNKRLNVRDTSLINLLRIPPPYIPIKEENQYYIDDSVINAFFELLRRRSEKFPNSFFKNYSLPTWIMSFLLSGKWSETEALSYLKIEEILGTLKLFVPVCLENHWILICVDIEKRTLLWLDSLNSSFYDPKKTIISEWIIKHVLPVLGYHNSQEWQFRRLLDIPYQTNRVDCGIFVMKYADCLVHGDYFPFTQENIPHFRRRVFLDIYRGRLPAIPALGFQKVDADHLEFASEGFLRGQKHLLRTISRREPANGHANQQPQQPRGQNSSVGADVEVGRFGLDEELERLKRDKDVLVEELGRLRLLQDSKDSQLQTIGQRLQGMEQRQQQMMRFLAKAIQSPCFLASFVS